MGLDLHAEGVRDAAQSRVLSGFRRFLNVKNIQEHVVDIAFSCLLFANPAAMLHLEFGVSRNLKPFLVFSVAGAAANQQWFATSPGAISWPSGAKEVCQVRAKLATRVPEAVRHCPLFWEYLKAEHQNVW